MKRSIIAAICLAAIPAFAQEKGNTRTGAIIPPDTVVRAGSLVVEMWKHPRITVVELPDTMVFLYRPNNTLSLDSIVRRDNLRGLINGSFFEGVRGNARHAGWLSIYGRCITPLMDDRQLSHVVRVSASGGKVEFYSADSFIPSRDPGVVEFQTGPLVIDSGAIRKDLIARSINGATDHARTLLAALNRSRLFFITVADRVSLSGLGSILLRFSVLKGGRLDVVNLDGGSSVALCLPAFPEFSYNSSDQLPVLIGFH